MRAFGCPSNRSFLLSSAGGTKGNNTAEAMRLVVIACCVRVVGSGARAENWRIVECVKLDRNIVMSAILRIMQEGDVWGRNLKC